MDIFHVGVHHPPFEQREVLCVGVRGQKKNFQGDQPIIMAQNAARDEGWKENPWFVQGVGPRFDDGQKARFFWFENRAES